MKRLLICSRSHSPHGGADRIIADLCRHLPARGWQVVLGLTRGERFNNARRYAEVLGEDLPVVEIDGRQGTRTARIKSLRRVIREARPDIVLSMRVFDAYEAVALEKSGSNEGPRLAIGVRSFEAPYLADLALYRGSVDLCVTSGRLIAAAAIHQSGMSPDRVVSIGGGVRPPNKTAVPRVTKRPLQLLYAGRLDNEQKRILDLPPFLRELDALKVPFELHLAGTGPAEADLGCELADRISQGTVTMHGWVSQSALYDLYYPRADCFLHFAAWEGMTIAPREAMAHGVVPVISQFPGLRLEQQFVDEESALTFPIGDYCAAAKCIQRLLLEEGLLTRLSRRASASQHGQYSFDGSMDSWAAALDACLLLPVCRGPLPNIPHRQFGRLSRWGVSGKLQDRLRDLFNRKVIHRSPGSEWPTASGMLTEQSRHELRGFAESLDSDAAGY